MKNETKHTPEPWTASVVQLECILGGQQDTLSDKDALRAIRAAIAKVEDNQ